MRMSCEGDSTGRPHLCVTVGGSKTGSIRCVENLICWGRERERDRGCVCVCQGEQGRGNIGARHAQTRVSITARRTLADAVVRCLLLRKQRAVVAAFAFLCSQGLDWNNKPMLARTCQTRNTSAPEERGRRRPGGLDSRGDCCAL